MKKVLGALLALLMMMTAVCALADDNNKVTIHYENDMHYVNLPDHRFIVYCMNSDLKWPHATKEHPNVPDYIEGYLDKEEQKRVLNKLALVLYAGYPNNGAGLYEIVGKSETPTISDDEFDAYLIPSIEIKKAFPELEGYEFSCKKINDSEQNQLITGISQKLVKADNEKKEKINDVPVSSIKNSLFYKAALCLAWTANSSNPTKEQAITLFSSSYLTERYVTERMAYDATQHAVWHLMNEAGIEKNENAVLLDNPLAEHIYNFATTAKLSDYLDKEPVTSAVKLSSTIKFSYDPATGKYMSNEFYVTAPDQYPKTYDVALPAGMKIVDSSENVLRVGLKYRLVSDTEPTGKETITLSCTAKWIRALKQYSPEGELISQQDKKARSVRVYQSVAGEVVDQKELTMRFGVERTTEGSLYVSKTISGSGASAMDEFGFVVSASVEGAPLVGVYGEMTFDEKGEARFSLRAGESKRADHLPAGTAYTVTEIGGDGYNATVNGKPGKTTSGKIAADTVAEAAFRNHLDKQESKPDNTPDDLPDDYEQIIAQMPKTGDEANIGLYLAMACLSLLGMAALMFGRKYRA